MADANPRNGRGASRRSEILRLQERSRRACRRPSWRGSIDEDIRRLNDLAGEALGELGGCADPPTWSLRDYDADRLGARLEQLDAGLTPVTDGWFVVSIPDAAG
jgi:hypothetical protein